MSGMTVLLVDIRRPSSSTSNSSSSDRSSCSRAAPDIVATINKEINAGLADPKLKARIADLGGVPMPMTPGDFGKYIAAETAKWAKVIKFAGIQVK